MYKSFWKFSVLRFKNTWIWATLDDILNLLTEGTRKSDSALLGFWAFSYLTILTPTFSQVFSQTSNILALITMTGSSQPVPECPNPPRLCSNMHAISLLSEPCPILWSYSFLKTVNFCLPLSFSERQKIHIISREIFSQKIDHITPLPPGSQFRNHL